MELIEELTKKYGGEYSEEKNKSSNFPSGKYSFHPKKGILTFDGSKISINVQAVGDASRVAEPYRLMLFLEKNFDGKLEIFPKTVLGRITSTIFSKKNISNSRIDRKYSFNGDNNLISELISEKKLCDLIEGERIYITINRNHPNKIILRPERGLEGIEQFEKFATILKLIESIIIKTAYNNA